MTAAAKPPGGLALKLRDSRLLLVLELVVLAGFFVADEHHLVPISKTLFLLPLAWLSLRLRGFRWRDVGLTLGREWPWILLAGLAAGVAVESFELFLSQPLLVELTGRQPDLSDFKDLVGRPEMLAFYLVLAWTLAAFGEEMVYRGWLLNRVAGALGDSGAAWTGAVLMTGVVFGLAHLYQGVTGVAENVLDAWLYGLIYLISGRRLMIPIIAHGVQDSTDFLLIFSGHYPGFAS